jgi:hypothetical protein
VVSSENDEEAFVDDDCSLVDDEPCVVDVSAVDVSDVDSDV